MESKIEHIFQLIVFDRREKLTRDTGEETVTLQCVHSHHYLIYNGVTLSNC